MNSIMKEIEYLGQENYLESCLTGGDVKQEDV